MALWRRSLADAAAAPPANNSLVLAAARTHRSDPFANLTAYSGGWNISDEHYWAVRHITSHPFVSSSSSLAHHPPRFLCMQSVAYTAVPLFLIAVLWFVGFGVVLLVISCCCCFCRSKSNAYSPGCYFSSLVLLIVLTMATM